MCWLLIRIWVMRRSQLKALSLATKRIFSASFWAVKLRSSKIRAKTSLRSTKKSRKNQNKESLLGLAF